MPKSRPEPANDRLQSARRRAASAAKRAIISSSALSRGDRETLLQARYLRRLMKGWYALASEPWPTSAADDLSDLDADLFHGFLGIYLEQRLGDRWCLSAESSLRFLLDPDRVPERIVALTEYGATTHHAFAGLTDLTVYRDLDRFPEDTTSWAGLRVMSPESAIARLKPAALEREPELLERSLSLVRHWADFADLLAREGRVTAAARLVEELFRSGRADEAAMLHRTMGGSGHRLPNPESGPIPAAPAADPLEPFRLQLLDWRLALEGTLPPAPAPETSLLGLLGAAQEAAALDALYSLQLSGFAISRERVLDALTEPERAAVAAGWPELDPVERARGENHTGPLAGDTDPGALLALQGYVEARRLVKKTIVRLLEEEPLAEVMRDELPGWHRALLGPAAEAGLEHPGRIGCWRNDGESGGVTAGQVPAALDLVWQAAAETADPVAAAQLVHVAIRRLAPWESANGRMARFALNTVATARHQRWVLLPGERRDEYEAALGALPARSLALALLKLYT